LAREDAALQKELAEMIRWRSTLREMQEGLARAFNLQVSYAAVKSYRQRRDREREAQEETQRNYRALAEAARDVRRLRGLALLKRIVEIECGPCPR
jgi:hypothetical protein